MRCSCSSVLRCCPRNTSFVQANCIFVILGYFITLIFGRSITAIVLSLLGIIVSMETYYAAAKQQRWMLVVFAVYMVCNAAACVTVGIVSFTGSDASCAGAQNPSACASTSVFYAAIMMLGASSLGIFAAINALLVYFTMPVKAAPDPLLKLLGG